jgi:hypothetical protein
VRRSSLVLLAAALAFAAATGFTSGATTSTTVGQTFPPDTSCFSNRTYIQTGSPPSVPYSVTADGIITSWSFQTNGETVPGLKLKVARPLGGGSYLFAGEAPAGSQVPSGVNTYAASVPVRAGDQIGIFVSSGFPRCESQTVVPGHLVTQFNGDPAPGSQVLSGDPKPPSQSGYRLPVTVTVTTGSCGGEPLTQVGSEQADTIVGTAERDVISGLAGNDKVSGLAGKDLICGGAGKDRLNGGKGKDELLGEKGPDTLKGGGGNDACKGGKGNDTLRSC